METHKKTSTNEVRRNFIAMLFALVVATIAGQMAALLSVVTNGWEQPAAIVEGLLDAHGLFLAPLMHLTLTLLLVSTSWIGWSASLAKGNKTDIQSFPLSLPFFLLLLEVFLVTLYFALTTVVEGKRHGFDMLPPIGTFSTEPSARPEAALFIVIYFVYAVWDFFADVLSARISPNKWRLNESILFLTGVLTHCAISIICVVLCIIIYSVLPSNPSLFSALLGDLALIAVVVFFWEGKALEYYPMQIFPWEAERKTGARRIEPVRPKSWVKILIALFFITVVACILNGLSW